MEVASKTCPILVGRKVSPHTIRHTTAMHLHQSGASITEIALWLGHESIKTTHRYFESDLESKERTLVRLHGHEVKPLRYKAEEDLEAFLASL